MGKSAGLQLTENFLSPAECTTLIALIAEYRAHYDVPLIYRPGPKRSLKYNVINGEEIENRLPAIQKLYDGILPLIQRQSGEQVVPLQSRTVRVNVNITPDGGSYRWHYDRNAVTAVLYLNEVTGGEIEAYPDYRILLPGKRASKLQSYFDRILQLGFFLRVFGRKRIIPPKPGLLVIMRGDRCLHSVTPVSGTRERICIVMSFDSPDASFPQEAALDSYLYKSQEYATKADPNYSSQ